MVRNKERDNAVDLLDQLCESMDVQCAEWLIEVFCVRQIHKELFVDCPIDQSRKFLIVLAKTAICKVSQEAKEKLL
jgi:hypothetical protein